MVTEDMDSCSSTRTSCWRIQLTSEVFGPQVICVASPTFKSALPLNLERRVQRKGAGSSGKANSFFFNVYTFADGKITDSYLC